MADEDRKEIERRSREEAKKLIEAAPKERLNYRKPTEYYLPAKPDRDDPPQPKK